VPAVHLDIGRAEVRPIAFETARSIIKQYEWLGTMPAVPSYCFGIFFDGVCGGAVTYGPEYAENLGVWDRYGYTGKIITLQRGACLPWAHPHSASKLIRRSMDLLASKYRVVTATVDAMAGEVGTIYQAAGFDYVGAMYNGQRTLIHYRGKIISERQARRRFGTSGPRALAKLGVRVATVPRRSRYFAFRGGKREQQELRAAILPLIKPYPKRPAAPIREKKIARPAGF
jgi:hypothetical protein